MRDKQLSQDKRYKSKLRLWRITSGVLLLLFIALGLKSNYFSHVLSKLKIIENNEKSGDFWAKKGWTNTLKKLNINSDIVFFGNSITYNSSFHEIFTDKEIVNLGYPGDNISGMLDRVEQVRCVHPKKIFMMAGTNDITSFNRDKFERQYLALVDSMLTVVPSDHLYIQSILPVSRDCKIDNNLIIECNEMIKDIAKKKKCIYIDLYSLYVKNGELPKTLTRDGVHIILPAYNQWAKKISAYIYE